MYFIEGNHNLFDREDKRGGTNKTKAVKQMKKIDERKIRHLRKKTWEK